MGHDVSVEVPGCLWPRSWLSLAAWLLVLSLGAGAAAWVCRPKRRYFCCRNDGVAWGAMRTLQTAQFIFMESDRDRDGRHDYGDLTELGQANLVDEVLSAGVKQGYRFQVVAVPVEEGYRTWWAAADPFTPGITGSVFYFTNHTGVIYATTYGPIRPRPGSKDLEPDRGIDVRVKSAREWWLEQ